MVWEVIGIVMLIVATAAQTAFVVIYGTASPWRSGFVGRSLFFKSLILSVAFDITVLHIFWDYPYQRVVGAMLMTLLAAGVVYQLVALVKQMFLSRSVKHQRATPQP